MKEIKLLIISHMYPNRSNPAKGIFVHQQVRKLLEFGCKAVVISPIPFTPRFLAKNQRRRGYREIPSYYNIEGVPVYYPRYIRPAGAVFHAISSLSMFISVVSCMKHIKKILRPEIIHSHAITPDGYTGLLLGKKLNIPTVVTAHGSDVNIYPYRDRLTYLMTKKTISDATKIIAVSNSIKRKILGIDKPHNPIDVVYNGVNLELFSFNSYSREELRRKINISKDDIVLIFIGSLLREKGTEELIKSFSNALKIIHQLHLIVIGDGPDLSFMISKVKEYNIEKKLLFVKCCPHNEIVNWLSASDILILPSWTEGHPNVVMEAMACSRPVIATKVGGIPETIKDGVTGILVDKGDVKAITQAIIELSNNSEKRKTMGEEGRSVVDKCFTWRKNAEKMLQIYFNILK